MANVNGYSPTASAPPEKRYKCTTQNSIIQPLLTDMYQLTMAYAYWKSGKTGCRAVFDVFFRRNPFHGEFTIFAGLEECLKFLEKFRYSISDIEFIRKALPDTVEPEFYQYLAQLSADEIELYAVKEGSVVFPRVPLLRVEGPLIVVQLVETTILNLVNFASLMTTNAARYRMAAGKIQLFEFGLRRAQGPDGGLSASKYAYMGGFDGTSNILAGKLYGIPVKGTHAHSYVTSFSTLEEVRVLPPLKYNTNVVMSNVAKFVTSEKNICTSEAVDFVQLSVDWRQKLVSIPDAHIRCVSEMNDGELAAFVSYAHAFPTAFLALIDTYDVQRSGLPNFCAVALALHELGYRALGVRIDSGDLAYLSVMCREMFRLIGRHFNIDYFSDFKIMASNDINEETILSLHEQGHEINAFGIGTHLVTCQKQPALGCVYKLVEVDGRPRIKLSQDVQKVTIPGRKEVFRLYGRNGFVLLDLLQRADEPEPKIGEKILCRHPFQESKRAFVAPSKVERLLTLHWSNGGICQDLPSLERIRETVRQSVAMLRPDIKRTLNPTPYKVSVSDNLYHYLHDLWLQNAPIASWNCCVLFYRSCCARLVPSIKC